MLWIRRGLTERRRRSAHVFRIPLVLSQAQFLTFRTNVHYNEAVLVALMGHSLVRASVLDAVLFRGHVQRVSKVSSSVLAPRQGVAAPSRGNEACAGQAPPGFTLRFGFFLDQSLKGGGGLTNK